MKYLSKILAFLSQVPNGNVTDSDLFVVICRALKEATDAGLIDSDDITKARLHSASTPKGHAIVSQSLVDALVEEVKFLKPLKEEYQGQARELRSRVDALENQVSDLKYELAKANDPRNASNQSQPKRRKTKAKAKPSVAEQMIAPVEDLGTTLPDGTFIACVVGK